MKSLLKSAGLFTFCAMCLPLGRATNVFSPALGDFNDTTNWTQGALPGINPSTDNNIIQGGNDATTSANHAATDYDVALIVRSNLGTENQSILNLQHDLNLESVTEAGNNSVLFVGFNAGHYGTIEHSAGLLTASTFILGETAATAPHSSYYNLSGLASVNSLNVTIQNDSFLNIVGDSANFVSNNATMSGTLPATLQFTLGTSGTTGLSIANNFTAAANSKLVVDWNSYSYPGGTDVITLVNAVNLTPFDVGNISFLNDPGLSYSVDQSTGGDVRLLVNGVIPEPSSFALVLVGLAAARVCRGRRDEARQLG